MAVPKTAVTTPCLDRAFDAKIEGLWIAVGLLIWLLILLRGRIEWGKGRPSTAQKWEE